jgi:predicted phage terminase large subunit-like protein
MTLLAIPLLVLALLAHHLLPGGGGSSRSNGPSMDETSLVADLCRKSFYEFVREFWHVVIHEEPVWNWHIKFLCDQFQEIAERVFNGEEALEDLIVNVPPGTTKSTIFSVMGPAWIWTRMPSARVMCASHAYNLGQDLQVKCREVVQSDMYRTCFPEVKIKEDQNTKGYFALETGGMRFVATVAGVSPMGFHAHFLIVDDPIDPKGAMSEAELKDANNWMTNTLPSRKIDKVSSVIMIIMQRLAQGDPTGERLKKKGAKPVRHICLPAELTDSVCPPELAKLYVNGLLDPHRLPRAVLKEAQSGGTYYYAGQYLQEPTPPGGGMFKVRKLKRGARMPMQWMKRVRFWDKAGTLGGGAYSVGVLMGKDYHERIWILDVVREQLDSASREDLIDETAEEDGEEVIIGVEIEGGSGGMESAEGTARRLLGLGYQVQIVKPKGKKEMRADPFSWQVNSGNVFLAEGDWVDEYVEELKFFPVSKYKDQVDASAGAYTIINEPDVAIGAL